MLRLTLEKRRLRGVLQPGEGQALLPGNEGQDNKKWPQVVPGRFRLDMRKNIFTERVVSAWHRLPRAAVDPADRIRNHKE